VLWQGVGCKQLLIGMQALAYLFQQSTYTFPVVGVQTVEHVLAMPDALRVKLSKDELDQIYEASPLNPHFPMNFLFHSRGEQAYHLGFNAADCQRDQMAAYINAPPRQLVSHSLKHISRMLC